MTLDTNLDDMMLIRFDVHFHDLACEYITVGVFDSFGSNRVNVTRRVEKTPVKHSGSVEPGRQYTEEELSDLDFGSQLLSDQQRMELDSDWTSTSDKFQHSSFREVLDAHEYTFVLFCMDSARICRLYFQAWEKFTAMVNEANATLMVDTEKDSLGEIAEISGPALDKKRDSVIRDADGRKVEMRALRINCEQGKGFEEECTRQKVKQFPTIRMYKRSAGENMRHVEISFKFPQSVMQMRDPHLTPEGLSSIVSVIKMIAQDNIKRFHTHAKEAHFHDVFLEGCRLKGVIEAPRVPGTLHFEAVHATDRSMNFAFVNASHEVRHLSFGTVSEAKLDDKLGPLAWWGAPPPAAGEEGSWVDTPGVGVQWTRPLDGRAFVVPVFHQGPQHYLKVVHTRWQDYYGESVAGYAMTHQWSLRRFGRGETPKARFSFDLSPLEVIHKRESKAWYAFATKVCALVGGTFAVIQLLASAISSFIAGNAVAPMYC